MKPVLKLYRGYANDEELIVMGHVLQKNAAHDYDFARSRFKHAARVIQMFRQRPLPDTDVYLSLGDRQIHTRTLDDGYFKFSIPLDSEAAYGKTTYEVTAKCGPISISAQSDFIRPHPGTLGFISDIDDTFLVSHAHNPLRKLYILLFKNLNKRKAFADVAEHYRALSVAGKERSEEGNAFFYVSGSEWNLYTFLREFTRLHGFPEAVLLLKDINNGLRELLFSRKDSLDHKFEKIKHVLEFYPKLNYTLLGDDSQRDPYIYGDICKIFPVNVRAVYMRQTGRHRKPEVEKALRKMEALNVHTCYFKTSAEAIAHSKKIGLIK